MQVILREDVKDLGRMGDILNVADGYGRNFLIPKKLAIEADPKNIKEFEHYKKIVAEKARKEKKAADDIAARISSTTITIPARAGEEDRLFGSVTAMDIAEALLKEGVEIDKRRIILEEPIKRLGTYTVTVKIHPETNASLNVIVVRE